MTAVETAITQENPLSIRGALLWGAQVLLQAGLENSRLDAEVLLRHVLDLAKEQLYMNGDAPISAGPGSSETGAAALAAEPVAGITGHKEFWSLDFLVSSAALILDLKPSCCGIGATIRRSACE
jgi:release factor glutamine methyltransferase